ncbi:hypothetical protein Tco_0195793 [Tanacetum coccineum]
MQKVVVVLQSRPYLEGKRKILSHYIAICFKEGFGELLFNVLMTKRIKVIAYAITPMKIHEKNYTTHDLELWSSSARSQYLEKEVVEHEATSLVVWSCSVITFCEIRFITRERQRCCDDLCRKERVSTLRVSSLSLTIGLDLSQTILECQTDMHEKP